MHVRSQGSLATRGAARRISSTIRLSHAYSRLLTLREPHQSTSPASISSGCRLDRRLIRFRL